MILKKTNNYYNNFKKMFVIGLILILNPNLLILMDITNKLIDLCKKMKLKYNNKQKKMNNFKN